MMITKNFSYLEMTRSDLARRLEIENEPGPFEMHALCDLCRNVLQPLRNEVGAVHVTSGFRSREVNKRLGGAKASQHMRGEAADIEVWGLSNLDLARTISRLELPYDQLILEFHNPDEGKNSGWVHVSHATNRRPRRQNLTAYKESGQTRYLHGLLIKR